MIRSLRARLFLAHALVLAATLVTFALLAARAQRSALLAHRAEDLTRTARVAAALVAVRGAEPPQAIATRLAAVLGLRVTLIAQDGRVLGDSGVPAWRLAMLENHGDRPEVRAALRGHGGTVVRHSHTLDADLLYAAAPVDAGAIRAVRIAQSLASVRRESDALLGLGITAVAVALAVGFVLLWVVLGIHARRLHALERVSERLGAAEPARAAELPMDEIGRLGRAINRMAEELRVRLGALERERDEREHILAHLSDGVALLDSGGRVVRVNQSLAEMLGAPLPVPGTPFRSFVRAPELDRLIADARQRGESVEGELRLWIPAPRVVRATATPLGSAGEGGVLLVLRDLTQVERLDRVRQDFVANVSHELRTPLTSLRGYADTLLEGGMEDAEHRESFVRVIRDQAERLSALVDDLLSLAELERPGAELRRETLDLRELIARQVAARQADAERAGLSLALEPGGPVTVHADRARLDQVVANLLDNALKYTEKGGVTVTVGSDDGRAWWEIADTGPGIPDEDLPRIFERFYRVDKARAREQGGTGLGLSIVRHIVGLHGGEVRVRTRLREGSAFRVEIPIVSSDPGPAGAPPGA